MSDYLTSGAVHFTGLGNGTDFDSMITQLVDVEKRKTQQLQAWGMEWAEKNEAFQELNTSLLSLKTTMEGMDTPSEFLKKNSVSTDETALSASAGSSASEGTNSVYINQLAQNDIHVSTTGLAETTDAVTTTDAVFKFEYNGETVSIDVPANMTLSGFVNMINEHGDNKDSSGQTMVRASLVNDGSEYHLQLRGMDQGADNQVQVLDSGFDTLAGFGSSDFEETQNAQNAQIKVDGWPLGDEYIERNSNTVSDVIEGLTLTLKEAGQTVQVNTATDRTQVYESLQEFVDGVNVVLSEIKSLTKVDTTNGEGEGSLLTGNYGLQMINQNIKDIISSKGEGFDYDADKFVSLASIGITTDSEENSPTFGLLVFDQDTLDSALDEDTQAVAEIFSADLVPSVESTDFGYHSLIKGVTKPGVFEVSYEVDGSGVVTSATIDGKNADISIVDGEYVLTSYEGDSRGLGVSVFDTSAGNYSGNVRIKEGKAGELVRELDIITDPQDGTLNILQDNYDSIIASIDDKIDYEATRIDRYERDLRSRYANLEATLGYYDDINSSLESQIAQLED